MGNTIDPSLLYTNNQSTERKTGSDILGKDDFLKILMVQLQNQDPMNPLQDKDFIAQMATFSSLEQMTNLNQTMQQFAATQKLLQGSTLIGKKVTWLNDKNELQSAAVTSASVKNGDTWLTLDNNQNISLDQITKIEN
ncbi:flagellar hook assembly protein FlgD [Heyndrickxia camelliae]|uniref:Flagellar hook assembly protein FlgD n=1 Tax=Heyndrickxia camelliae TaxID=1707093 RepID=A0A2N3LQZ1_9BACI|nr:flagellar hook assembly protein FlgD [Heyndrickxia camelliae]PKR87062.1 flagellar hook assembly protein FlgD [Heyndrickxia camelliae]